MRVDVRNVLAIPRPWLDEVRFRGSPGLNTAFLGNLLLPVDSSTILSHSFPCCAPGGACCPYDDERVFLRAGCCSHWRADSWLKSTVQNGGADLQWFSRRRWYDQRNVFKFGSPQEQLLQIWRMRRPANESGLSNDHLYWSDRQSSRRASAHGFRAATGLGATSRWRSAERF
jgi:hypothetical protein